MRQLGSFAFKAAFSASETAQRGSGGTPVGRAGTASFSSELKRSEWTSSELFREAPANTMKVQQTVALSTGAEQLTVEAAVGHLELLEVRESAPFRRNSTSKLVRSAAKNRVATRQIENLKRSWKHLWQRACANKTPNSVAKIKPLSTGAERTCQRPFASDESN